MARLRTIAIDWSGRAKRAQRYIWAAEAEGGQLVSLERDKSREQIGDWLMRQRAEGGPVIIGLDFAFSMPEWFLARERVGGGSELWQRVAADGERWLSECSAPFWGKPGKKKVGDGPWLRETDALAVSGGIGAKSVFQIGGAGAVGTGSIRGMPLLHRLRKAGWAIWPFDPPGSRTVVEIYPRLLTGAVTKSRLDCRERYLSACYPALNEEWKTLAASSEDAFDAAVSALRMEQHATELRQLPTISDKTLRREGLIWMPGLFRA